MTTTETEQETATAPRREYHCPICGSIGKSLLGPYAHNTCSQLCAIAAAIVEAIGKLGATVEVFYGELAEDLAQLPYEPVDGTPT